MHVVAPDGKAITVLFFFFSCLKDVAQMYLTSFYYVILILLARYSFCVCILHQEDIEVVILYDDLSRYKKM